MNWEKDFYGYWDAFVKEWHDNKALPSDEVTKAFVYRYLDELPEPYIGSHKDAQMVVINYNPGASSEVEAGKFYSNLSPDTLIEHFRNACNHSYRQYISDKSPFKAETHGVKDEPSIKWWNQRCAWLKRFHGYFSKKPFEKERIFALEMSPFHSLRWDDEILSSSNFEQVVVRHIREKVIVPAVSAVIENNLPCVICVGLGIGGFLKEKLKMPLILAIKDGKLGSECRVVQEWPKGRRGKPVKRTYMLLELNVGSAEWKPYFNPEHRQGCTIPFLIIGSQGSNRLPGNDFEKFEKHEIVARLKK